MKGTNLIDYLSLDISRPLENLDTDDDTNRATYLPQNPTLITFPVSNRPEIALADVVYDIRSQGGGLETWWESPDLALCSICLEFHSDAGPLFYTPCSHLYHQECWQRHVASPRAHYLDNNLGTIVQTCSRCPACLQYVAGDTFGNHHEILSVPVTPLEYPDGFIVHLPDGAITLRYRAVPQQPQGSALCGPLAIRNVHALLHTPQSILNDGRGLDFVRSVGRRMNFVVTGGLDLQQMQEIIAMNVLPDTDSFLLWAPTQPEAYHDDFDARVLQAYEEQQPLGIIMYTQGHFVGVLITPDGLDVTVDVMETHAGQLKETTVIVMSHLIPRLRAIVPQVRFLFFSHI